MSITFRTSFYSLVSVETLGSFDCLRNVHGDVRLANGGVLPNNELAPTSKALENILLIMQGLI